MNRAPPGETDNTAHTKKITGNTVIMTKLHIAIIALVLFLTLGTAGASAGSFAIGADAPVIVAGSTETVIIPFNVTGADKLSSLDMTIAFGTSSHGATVALSKTAPIGSVTINPANGKTSGYYQPPVTGDRTLYYISITPGTQPETIPLTLTVTSIKENDATVTYTIPTDLSLSIIAGPDHLTTITANPADPDKHIIGTEIQLSTEVQDTANNPLTGCTILWTSSNPAVVSVDTTGKCTLHTLGTAVITASVPDYPGVPSQTIPITTQASCILLNENINAGPTTAANGWSADNNSAATYRAHLTGTEYTLPVPTFTRDGITAPVLTGADTTKGTTTVTCINDTGVAVTPFTINGESVTIPASDAGNSLHYDITFTGRKLGDVDGDAGVNAADARTIANYIVGITDLDPYQRFYADVDGKNGVTTLDALAILEMAVDYRDTAYKPTEYFWNR